MVGRPEDFRFFLGTGQELSAALAHLLFGAMVGAWVEETHKTVIQRYFISFIRIVFNCFQH
jgi:hypothetical protein